MFTRRTVELGFEDALRQLQLVLSEHPGLADLEPGTGGLRKARMADERRGKGKRSGARVHYLWIPNRSLIYLLHLYTKDQDTKLSEEQKRLLKAVVAEIKRPHTKLPEEKP